MEQATQKDAVHQVRGDIGEADLNTTCRDVLYSKVLGDSVAGWMCSCTGLAESRSSSGESGRGTQGRAGTKGEPGVREIIRPDTPAQWKVWLGHV
jgi:hypothetical protein